MTSTRGRVLLTMIGMVLLGFLLAAVERWLGMSRAWTSVVAAVVGGAAVYLLMRNRA